MNKFLVSTACFLLLSSPVHAVDIEGNYAVWGTGKKSCFGFQKDMENGKVEHYKNYMKGFITAYNIFTDKTYSISGNMDENQIIAWLTAYCQDNPMTSFEGALTNFTFDHYDERMKSAKSSPGGSSW